MKTGFIIFLVVFFILLAFGITSLAIYRHRLKKKQQLKAGDYVSFRFRGEKIFGRILSNNQTAKKADIIAFGTKYIVDYKDILK